MSEAFFPYRVDWRFAALWLPVGVRPGRDGVHVDPDTSWFRATFGVFGLATPLDNVAGGHITEGYRWYTAVGPRLSFVDDGLTFGTNRDRGVCVHFREPRSPIATASSNVSERPSPSPDLASCAACGPHAYARGARTV